MNQLVLIKKIVSIKPIESSVKVMKTSGVYVGGLKIDYTHIIPYQSTTIFIPTLLWQLYF